ncbi:hypothetical protein D3C85_1584330 [compost metagenome]
MHIFRNGPAGRLIGGQLMMLQEHQCLLDRLLAGELGAFHLACDQRLKRISLQIEQVG